MKAKIEGKGEDIGYARVGLLSDNQLSDVYRQRSIFNIRTLIQTMAPQGSPSISRKRKNGTDEADDGRVIKHRASQACQSCRMRKYTDI